MTTRTVIVTHFLTCKSFWMLGFIPFSLFEFYCSPTFIVSTYWYCNRIMILILQFILVAPIHLVHLSNFWQDFLHQGMEAKWCVLWCVVTGSNTGKCKLTTKCWEVHYWTLGQGNLWVSKAKKKKTKESFLEKCSVFQVLERAGTTKQFQWENFRTVIQCYWQQGSSYRSPDLYS